jgi:hypothetical protein
MDVLDVDTGVLEKPIISDDAYFYFSEYVNKKNC